MKIVCDKLTLRREQGQTRQHKMKGQLMDASGSFFLREEGLLQSGRRLQ
jgi:hypothetical protein